MPRVSVKNEPLDDSINTPVPRRLKRRLIDICNKLPGQPPHTRMSRSILSDWVEAKEREIAAKDQQLVTA